MREKWWQKFSSEFVIVRRVVAKLSLFLGSGNLIMAGLGWLWLVAVNIISGCGWSWVVGMKSWPIVGGGGEIIDGLGWSWMVEGGGMI